MIKAFDNAKIIQCSNIKCFELFVGLRKGEGTNPICPCKKEVLFVPWDQKGYRL